MCHLVQESSIPIEERVLAGRIVLVNVHRLRGHLALQRGSILGVGVVPPLSLLLLDL